MPYKKGQASKAWLLNPHGGITITADAAKVLESQRLM
jgi:hypothetical protein